MQATPWAPASVGANGEDTRTAAIVASASLGITHFEDGADEFGRAPWRVRSNNSRLICLN